MEYNSSCLAKTWFLQGRLHMFFCLINKTYLLTLFFLGHKGYRKLMFHQLIHLSYNQDKHHDLVNLMNLQKYVCQLDMIGKVLLHLENIGLHYIEYMYQ